MKKAESKKFSYIDDVDELTEATYSGNPDIKLRYNMKHWVYFILGMLTATAIIICLVMASLVVNGSELKSSNSASVELTQSNIWSTYQSNKTCIDSCVFK